VNIIKITNGDEVSYFAAKEIKNINYNDAVGWIEVEFYTKFCISGNCNFDRKAFDKFLMSDSNVVFEITLTHKIDGKEMEVESFERKRTARA
jgi:hypothetical protein